ncbi:hypothetical protein ACHAXS_006516, partial [Conticribra weissflogii]
IQGAQLAGGACVVEDTSLEFNALGGMPGPFIKWFQDKLGCEGLYKILIGYEDKSATAVCTLAFCPYPHADPVLFTGKCNGRIVEPVLGRGFGWDSIFVPDGESEPFSCMSTEKKCKLSHRSKAVVQWADWLGKNLDELWERQYVAFIIASPNDNLISQFHPQSFPPDYAMLATMEDQGQCNILEIILAVDAGSSSIRCTAYERVESKNLDDDGAGNDYTNRTCLERIMSSNELPSPIIRALENMCHTIQMASVVPNSGYIRIKEVLAGIDECIDEVLRLLRLKFLSQEYEVVAVGFSTFVMNLVGVNEFGEPIGESATLSYACNREDVVLECQKLRDHLGNEKIRQFYQSTGAPIHPAYALPQLLAFYRNVDNPNDVYRWQTISSICIHRWTGDRRIQLPISYSEASWTGMLNFRTCDWNGIMLKLLEVLRTNDGHAFFGEEGFLPLLPGLVDYDGEVAGKESNFSGRGCSAPVKSGIPPTRTDESNNPYWERWPELRRCKFFLGIGDGAAANVGSKCGSTSLTEPRIAVTIGTSAAARVCLPFPVSEQPNPCPAGDIVIPPGLFCYRVDRNRLLLGGALTDGGSVVEWARSLLNLQSKESFDVCMEKVVQIYEGNRDSSHLASPNSKISMVPFLSGERSTGFRVGARACMSGMTRETTPAQFMYACLEAVILRLGAIMKLIVKVCSGLQTSNLEDKSTNGNGEKMRSVIVASGNALERNSLWRQMLADCTGIGVVVDGDAAEGTSRGVAIMIGGSTGNMKEEKLSTLSNAKPGTIASAYWTQSSISQNNLIDAISPTWTN